jgi:hypothetical protein
MLTQCSMNADADAVPDVCRRLLIVSSLGLPEPDILCGHCRLVSPGIGGRVR